MERARGDALAAERSVQVSLASPFLLLIGHVLCSLRSRVISDA